jgi:ribosomal protein S18 acetylase RimI-like enzyme
MVNLDVFACRGRNGVPRAAEVESLYSAAFHGKPHYEPQERAAQDARLYVSLTPRRDLMTVFARVRQAGTLAGLAYGHPWRWAEQADDWAGQLRERLGDAAASLEDRFAVYLLAVHPDYRRRGLGRTLLRSLLQAAGADRAWLITRDEPTPAMELYKAEGWRSIGHGPDAPNGRPSLVLAQG